MSAFYNDNDAFMAEWLGNLVEAGEITHGIVDDRSVHDLPSDAFEDFARVHLCAGIGGWDHALDLAKWGGEVLSCSMPCQPFSIAGKGLGTEDERHLWPTVFKLIKASRPPVVFGEQVDSPEGRAWFDKVCDDCMGIGYDATAMILPAAAIGAPHLRHRLYYAFYPDDEKPTRDLFGVPSPAGLDPDGRAAKMVRSVRSQLEGIPPAPEYNYRWKWITTPAGRMIPKLLGTSKKDMLVGWPTAAATDRGGGTSDPPPEGVDPRRRRFTLQDAVKLVGYPTPMAADSERSSGTFARGNDTLVGIAKLTGYPTPMAADGESVKMFQGGKPSLGTVAKLTGYPTPKAGDGLKSARTFGGAVAELDRKAGNNDLGAVAMLVGWATPLVRDAKSEEMTPEVFEKYANRPRGNPLSRQVKLVGWATPTARDAKDGQLDLSNTPINAMLGRQALVVQTVETRGESSSSSPAKSATESGRQGALASLFVGTWIQGYPTSWFRCAPPKKSTPGTSTPPPSQEKRDVSGASADTETPSCHS